MSKSSGSFLSLPTIIFLIVMYNVIFDDDDEKDIDVKTEENPIISEDLKKELEGVGDELKEVGEELKGVFKKALDDYKKDNPEPEPEVIISEEKKVEEPKPELKPLEEDKPEEEMRSL